MPPVTTTETETVFYHGKEVPIEQAINLCPFLGAAALEHGLEVAMDRTRSFSEIPTSEQDTDLQLTDDDIYNQLMGLDENTNEPDQNTKDDQTPVDVEQDYQPWSIFQRSDNKDKQQHEQSVELIKNAEVEYPETPVKQNTITTTEPTERHTKNVIDKVASKEKIIKTKPAKIVSDVKEEIKNIVKKKPTEIAKPKIDRHNIFPDELEIVDAIESIPPEPQKFQSKPELISIEKTTKQEAIVVEIEPASKLVTTASFEQPIKTTHDTTVKLPIDIQTDFVDILDLRKPCPVPDSLDSSKTGFSSVDVPTDTPPADKIRFESNPSDPDDETPLSLEIIQEQANEQAIEKTLTQLVYLIESVETTKDVELELVLQQVTTRFKTIEKDLLSGINQKGTKLGEIPSKITKEIFELLRLLGYDDPKSALNSFIQRCDMVMLIQALEYIVQCQSKNKPHETLKKTHVFFKTQSTSPPIARIGKYVVQLLHNNSWNLQLLPVKE